MSSAARAQQDLAKLRDEPLPEETLCYGPEYPTQSWEDHPWHPFNLYGRMALLGLALFGLGCEIVQLCL